MPPLISPPTCMRRMRRLESSGVIRAHTALLNPSRIGFAVMAFVEVTLVNAAGAEMAAFERRMSRCPEVTQCSELAGDVDYLLTVQVREMQEFADFSRAHLADDPRIRSGYLHHPLARRRTDSLTGKIVIRLRSGRDCCSQSSTVLGPDIPGGRV